MGADVVLAELHGGERTSQGRAGEMVFNFPLTPPPAEVTISLFGKNGDALLAISNGFVALGDELILEVQFTPLPEDVREGSAAGSSGESVRTERIGGEEAVCGARFW